jgi:hypothetical protein
LLQLNSTVAMRLRDARRFLTLAGTPARSTSRL